MKESFSTHNQTTKSSDRPLDEQRRLMYQYEQDRYNQAQGSEEDFEQAMAAREQDRLIEENDHRAQLEAQVMAEVQTRNMYMHAQLISELAGHQLDDNDDAERLLTRLQDKENRLQQELERYMDSDGGDQTTKTEIINFIIEATRQDPSEAAAKPKPSSEQPGDVDGNGSYSDWQKVKTNFSWDSSETKPAIDTSLDGDNVKPPIDSSLNDDEVQPPIDTSLDDDTVQPPIDTSLEDDPKPPIDTSLDSGNGRIDTTLDEDEHEERVSTPQRFLADFKKRRAEKRQMRDDDAERSADKNKWRTRGIGATALLAAGLVTFAVTKDTEMVQQSQQYLSDGWNNLQNFWGNLYGHGAEPTAIDPTTISPDAIDSANASSDAIANIGIDAYPDASSQVALADSGIDTYQEAASHVVENGEGWNQTMTELGIPSNEWGTVLQEAGPKLAEMTYPGQSNLPISYLDTTGGLNEWRINMPSNGQMPQAVLDVISNARSK